MSKVYETLKKKNDTSVEVYPNIERQNIPNGAVNSAKIEDGSITTNKIVDNAVTRTKINNGAVNSDKLDDGAVISDKIADGNVTTDKLDDGAVTNDKIGIGAVHGINLNFGIFEHIYECTDSVQHIHYIIRFISSHQPFNDAVDLFDYLYTYYGIGAPVAIQKNTKDLTDIFGYVNDENNIEFTDTNDETFNSNYANVTFADYSKSLF